jgi:hypothetical protein
LLCRDRTLYRGDARARLGQWEGGEVDHILGQLLRQAVWERLDMFDEQAAPALTSFSSPLKP